MSDLSDRIKADITRTLHEYGLTRVMDDDQVDGLVDDLVDAVMHHVDQVLERVVSGRERWGDTHD